jgi:hypothetical protein
MSIMATEPAAADDCRICRAPSRDHAYYCDPCRTKLDIALGNMTWLDEQIDVSITRQKGVNLNSGGSKSAETPIPWHDKAAEARRHLHGILVLWVKYCTDENVRGTPTWAPRDNLPSMARFLLHCTHGLSLLDIGPDAHDEITKAVADCERIIFWKKRSRSYLGPCEARTLDEDGHDVGVCTGDVYAEEDADIGKCDLCGEGVTVVIRQGELNKKLDSRLCTAAELARICVYLGLDAPRDKVRKKVHYWHAHKRIVSHATDPAGDPMFRYGEVRVMLYAAFSEKVKS